MKNSIVSQTITLDLKPQYRPNKQQSYMAKVQEEWDNLKLILQ